MDPKNAERLLLLHIFSSQRFSRPGAISALRQPKSELLGLIRLTRRRRLERRLRRPCLSVWHNLSDNHSCARDDSVRDEDDVSYSRFIVSPTYELQLQHNHPHEEGEERMRPGNEEPLERDIRGFGGRRSGRHKKRRGLGEGGLETYLFIPERTTRRSERRKPPRTKLEGATATETK